MPPSARCGHRLKKGLSLRRLYGPSGSCRVTPPTVNQQTEQDRHQPGRHKANTSVLCAPLSNLGPPWDASVAIPAQSTPSSEVRRSVGPRFESLMAHDFTGASKASEAPVDFRSARSAVPPARVNFARGMPNSPPANGHHRCRISVLRVRPEACYAVGARFAMPGTRRGECSS